MPLDIDGVIRSVNGWHRPGLRTATAIIAAAHVGLWCYFWVFIAQHSNPQGDGLEWAAIVPATAIVALFGVPALIIAAINRLLIVGAVFAVIGAVLNGLLFVEVVGELTHAW